jgi:hypothetical protein
MEEDDYQLSIDLFRGKIAKLEPKEQVECIAEYCRRQNEKLTAEKDKVTAENEKLAAEKDKVTAENEKLAAEKEKVTAEKEILVQKEKLYQSIQSLTIGATSDIFRKITALDRATTTEWKTCSMEGIVYSWEQCRDIKNTENIPDLAAMSNVNERQVQAAFSNVVKIILNNLHYRHAVTETRKVDGSQQVPDLVIAKQGCTNPGFQDVFAVIELKTPSTVLMNAAVQAGKYLAEISNSRIDTNRSLTAIGTNYQDVCIFGFQNRDSVPILTLYDIAPCFPKGWKDLGTPTDGFMALCHAIHQTGDSTSRIIVINESDVVITGTIHEMEGIGVYRCTYLQEELVVKQGYGKRGKGFVEHELQKLKTVSKIAKFQPFLLPWKQDLNIQHGYAMPLGTVITDPLLFVTDWEGFLDKQYRWLIQGLSILHEENLYHMDIRPGNIIIYENTARLIDWLTLQRGDVINAWLRQGHDDPFWPVHRDKFNEKNLFYLWDLISLGYTFLFLAIKELSIRLKMQTDRLEVVQDWLKDTTFVGKMARIIQYLETTPTDTARVKLYEMCLAMQ